MARWRFTSVGILLLAGCVSFSSQNPNQIISKALPVSLIDIAEIRAGEEAHKGLFEPNANGVAPNKLYPSPELSAYATRIGMRIAAYCQRPNLPYQFFILDTDRVEVFGLGGGRVYVTRGYLNFVSSEDELAAGIAHEIGHIATFHYTPPKPSKVKTAYGFVLRASEYADDAVGIYGSAGRTGIKAVGEFAPKIKNKFSANQEEIADRNAVIYLSRAGYDPRALVVLVDKLSKVEVERVGKFAEYMKAHPPLPKRRGALSRQAAPLYRKFQSAIVSAPIIPIEIQPTQSPAGQTTTIPIETAVLSSQS